ncbi:MAG: isochorismate synthase [Acidimicrobiales bacterium]
MRRPSESSPLPLLASNLRCVTRELEASSAPGLLETAGEDGLLVAREGAGLAARGVAMRIPLPGGLWAEHVGDGVQELLSAIQSRDEVGLPGCGPVAMGALPFDPDRPAELLVPSQVVGRSPEGRTWVTTIAPAGAPERPVLAPVPGWGGPRWPPDGFNLSSDRSHQDWCNDVAGAIGAIRRGEMSKVVLARQVTVAANRPILVGDVLCRLAALYPSCALFSIEGFVGASPELLVRRRGTAVVSMPLAGTVARSGDADADARLEAGLLGSQKDRAEHALVVDDVAKSLWPLCAELHVPDAPSLVRLRNVSHLGTRLDGMLSPPAPGALGLAAALHPTPAVAGSPRAAALGFLQSQEPLDRGLYAGPVGWVDASGDGDWWVGIRSAMIRANEARLLAGVGVVADSEPRAELAETQLKLQALLAAVVRP